MNSTFLVDEFSITFLYVSSSDLVLKNNNTKDYHFAIHKQYHKQTRMQKLFDMPPTCESMKMTHTKIRSFQIRHIMCSAIVPTGYNCSKELFLCFYLSGIQSPRDISAASIFVPLLWSSRSPTLYLPNMLLRVLPVLHHWCSFEFVLILDFLRRCLSLLVVLCLDVLSSVSPISDMFLHCMRACHTHMGCCSTRMSSYLLMGSLPSM